MPGLAVLFDLDGVISDTASLHAKAWKAAFDDTLAQHPQPAAPFVEPTDYIVHLDGKTRLAGIRSFLESRNIDLILGQPDDTGFITIQGIGNEKNAIFRRLLLDHGVNIFADSRRLIDKLLVKGAELGVASSSKNAAIVLENGGLAGCFKSVMDGIVAEQHNIASKPDGAFYRHAAHLLGRHPSDCIALEDAISGVASARNAGIRTVIGVARYGGGHVLRESGAHIVVSSLDELKIDNLGAPAA